jgi:hypothetical protein
MAGQVKRYDVDGNQLKTGHHVGSLARTLPHADKRVEALEAHQAEQAQNEDRDLLSKFREAEESVGIPQPLAEAENGLDAAILAMNAAAGERNAAKQMTKEEKLGAAVADALVERGIVSEPPSPVAGDEYDQPLEDDELDYLPDGEYGQAEDGTLLQAKDGVWHPVDLSADADLEEEEPPPEDQWPSYNTSNTNEQFLDLRDNSDDGEELDDAA